MERAKKRAAREKAWEQLMAEEDEVDVQSPSSIEVESPGSIEAIAQGSLAQAGDVSPSSTSQRVGMEESAPWS